MDTFIWIIVIVVAAYLVFFKWDSIEELGRNILTIGGGIVVLAVLCGLVWAVNLFVHNWLFSTAIVIILGTAYYKHKG